MQKNRWKEEGGHSFNQGVDPIKGWLTILCLLSDGWSLHARADVTSDILELTDVCWTQARRLSTENLTWGITEHGRSTGNEHKKQIINAINRSRKSKTVSAITAEGKGHIWLKGLAVVVVFHVHICQILLQRHSSEVSKITVARITSIITVHHHRDETSDGLICKYP